MKTMLKLSAALILLLGLTEASMAQGRGNDKDKSKGPDKHAARDFGGDRDDGPGKGKGKHKDKEKGNRGDRGVGAGGREDDHGRDRADRGDKGGRDVRLVVREGDRIVVVRRDRHRDVRLITGCPPGLAKKDNGCLPPGQAKKLARARYDALWGRRPDGSAWRYDDGYLYHLDRRGAPLGYLPALGGALGIGNRWPEQYRYDPAPTYLNQYFRLNAPDDYRYADGAIYQVDPKTQAISAVVALLTGQPINVGQTMPSGYDVYNVPSAYRSQYADTADRDYRYNDGYVYQVDPTTQVVQAIIKLLT